MNIRIELEKDIKTLQDEVSALKAENKQLRADKEDVEQQFIEYKVSNEKRVTKLRGIFKIWFIFFVLVSFLSPSHCQENWPPCQWVLPRHALRWERWTS